MQRHQGVIAAAIANALVNEMLHRINGRESNSFNVKELINSLSLEVAGEVRRLLEPQEAFTPLGYRIAGINELLCDRIHTLCY
jgi:hypothetical protein